MLCTKTNHRNILFCYCHQVLPIYNTSMKHQNRWNEPTKPVLESRQVNLQILIFTIQCIRSKDASIAYADQSKWWNIEAYLSKFIAFIAFMACILADQISVSIYFSMVIFPLVIWEIQNYPSVRKTHLASDWIYMCNRYRIYYYYFVMWTIWALLFGKK